MILEIDGTAKPYILSFVKIEFQHVSASTRLQTFIKLLGTEKLLS